MKRRVLEKRGFITSEGDVICHSMKELNQYRDMLYWNYHEMLKALREDVNRYMPKILAKRRAIAVSCLLHLIGSFGKCSAVQVVKTNRRSSA